LPGYLIRLVPELRVEEQIVATGPALTMGSDLIQNAAYFNVGIAQWEAGADNQPIVGEYIATALDLQNVSSAQLTNLQSTLGLTKVKLEQFQQNPNEPNPPQSLIPDTLTGDLLYAAVLSYFVAIDTTGQLAARDTRLITIRMPSFGNFGITSEVQLFFGFPRTVAFPAFEMDIDRVVGSEVAKNSDNATVISFRKAIGWQYSALEHLTPERLFQDPAKFADDPSQPQAISAVKAIAVAVSEGQKVYILNSGNQAIHASTINQLNIDQVVKQEIANALTIGKEVIVHQENVSHAGFIGAGYIIIDPETGAGAYKISSGASGAKIILGAAGLVLVFSGTAAVSPFLLGIFIGLGIFLAIYSVLLNAILILDEGGPCARLAAQRYLQFFVPITLFASLFGLSGGANTAAGLMLTLVGIMYGGNLFKGFVSSKACQ
jgi:hypothetical protein